MAAFWLEMDPRFLKSGVFLIDGGCRILWVAKCALVFAVLAVLSKVSFDYIINSQFKYTVFEYLLNNHFK